MCRDLCIYFGERLAFIKAGTLIIVSTPGRYVSDLIEMMGRRGTNAQPVWV